MKLVDRDYRIFSEVYRWRWCLGRHIRFLAGFDGSRACDRRLRVLIDNGYLERRYILYGVPGLYLLTGQAKMLLGLPQREEKIRVEQILHDILVLDTVIYFLVKHKIALADILSEKQMQSKDGFGGRKHFPDFIFTQGEMSNCVEIEIATKSKGRLDKIISDNFNNYDKQYWIIPDTAYRNLEVLYQSKKTYSGIEVIPLEEVKEYVGHI